MKKGFTLIELLVVIAIIGLLSSIVLASLGAARSKAADAAIQANITGVRSGAEIHYVNNGDRYHPTNTGVIYDSSCLGYSNPSALFAETTIKRAIQEAYNLNGLGTNGLVCAAEPKSYSVAVALKTQDDGDSDNSTNDFFCVDSTGVAKILNEVRADSAIAASAPYRCL